MDRLKIKKAFPKISDAMLDAILTYAPRYGITPAEMPMFLAQAGHESSEFTDFEENLNYSDVGLANTWPTRYGARDEKGNYIKEKVPNSNPIRYRNVPNGLAKKIARNPQLIANHTYAGRIGNGPVESGDGWRFRGRGIFQLTGRGNYENFAKAHPDIPVMSDPDILLRPAEAVISACWFWRTRGLAKHANNVVAATKTINGGDIGLAHRKKLFEMLV